MKFFLSVLFFATAVIAGDSVQAQSSYNIHYPYTGGDTTLYPPSGYKFTTAPSSTTGMTVSVASDGSACEIHTLTNTTYSSRNFTWYFVATQKLVPHATLQSYYFITQDAYVPPPFAEQSSSTTLWYIDFK